MLIPKVEYVDVLIDPSEILLKKKDYDVKGIKELSLMIAESGLQNPPIIKENREIVAGGRRVLAAILAELNPVKVRQIPNDTAEAICETISLHENLGRDNLQWYDQVLMHKRLHDLRQQVHGKGQRGKKSGWSLRDTANELDMGLGNLSENIRLADAVLADPNLRKIQDKTTAIRVVLTAQKRTTAELGTALPHQIETNQIIHASSEQALKALPDFTFDAVITDPPWLEYKNKALIKDEFTWEVFKQVYRVMKRDSFMYVFVSTNDFYIYRSQLESLGFSVQKWPVIWVKEGVLSMGGRMWNYNRNYEPIIVAVKGAPALTRNMLSSIYSTPIVPPIKVIHENEKPTSIIKILLEHSTYEGSLVLDPFGGSGATAEACLNMQRKFIIIERDANSFVKIKNRILQLQNK